MMKNTEVLLHNDLTPAVNNSCELTEEVEVPIMADQAESLLYNRMMDRTAIRQLISRLTIHFGVTHTTNILDQIKILGFQQATKAYISSGIDDLSTVPSKGWLV